MLVGQNLNEIIGIDYLSTKLGLYNTFKVYALLVFRHL